MQTIPLAARCGVAVIGAVLACGSAQATDIVVNGNFETGDFTGWTQFGNGDFTAVTPAIPHSGTYGATFGPISTSGGIFQLLPTVAGERYLVEFHLANENDDSAPHAFEFNWDGGAPELALADAAPFGYTRFAFDLVASGASTEIRFTFRSDPAFYNLDDVSVSVVPEPSSTLMALAGVGLLLSVVRARRRPAG